MTSKWIALVGCLAVLSVSCVQKPKAAPLADGQSPQGGTWSVDGILTASEIYFQGPDSPKGYVVRDPANQSIKAYVQSTKGAVDLSPFAGQRVEVVGQVHQDTVSGLVVEAQKIVALEGGVAAPPAPLPPGEPAPPKAVETPAGAAPVPAEPATEPVGPKDLAQ